MGSLHARVLAQSERTDLVCVVEPREEAGREVAERYGAVWQPELDDLSGVDAVVIAAPTESHFALAEHVLNAGVPLLIEKPVCGTLGESEHIVASADKRGVPILCGLLERFNPAVLTAFALVDRPVHFSATRHSPYAPRIRTGVAWDLLVHDIDLAIQAFGGQEPTDGARQARPLPSRIPSAGRGCGRDGAHVRNRRAGQCLGQPDRPAQGTHAGDQ